MSSQSVKVSDIMTKKLETVRSSSSAQDIAIRMRDKQVSSVLVIDDKNGRPQGIVTERDLSRKVCVSDKNSSTMLSSQIMSSPLITINADSSPTDAADLMLKNNVRHLLVMTQPSQDKDKNESMDDESVLKPIGIITPMDFTRFEATSTLEENKNVDDGDEDEDHVIKNILNYYKNAFNFA
jgi:CBS domain-containing protein